MFLNDYYQYNNTYSETLKTSLHEFGHALGLGHTNYSTNNVMIGGTRSYKGKLGQGDIACYRYLWGGVIYEKIIFINIKFIII